MRNVSPVNALLRTPATIVNGFSSGSPTPIPLAAGSSSPNNAKSTLSGALTANTLATALSVTGAGVLHFAAVSTVDATARTLRLKVTLDGVSVFDSTSASVSTAERGIIAVGNLVFVSSTASNAIFQDVPFNASCLIEIASSLTETDKLYSHVAYRTV